MTIDAELPLFAYGTFRDPRWRRRILAHDYPAQPAVITGWRRAALEVSGYLTLLPSPYDLVDGVLIDLDAYGWRIADAWEEVPTYLTEEVTARTAEGERAARVYIAANQAGPRHEVNDRALALLPDDDIERAIDTFRRANLWIRGRWELVLYNGERHVGGGRYDDERLARATGKKVTGEELSDDEHLLMRTSLVSFAFGNDRPDRYVVRFDPDPSRPQP